MTEKQYVRICVYACSLAPELALQRAPPSSSGVLTAAPSPVSVVGGSSVSTNACPCSLWSAFRSPLVDSTPKFEPGRFQLKVIMLHSCMTAFQLPTLKLTLPITTTAYRVNDCHLHHNYRPCTDHLAYVPQLSVSRLLSYGRF